MDKPAVMTMIKLAELDVDGQVGADLFIFVLKQIAADEDRTVAEPAKDLLNALQIPFEELPSIH